ncbi:MAG TPA: hypothetical protein VN956_17755 [Pyrinomonadaceae bacterium]|nr:hypothetical protein [Pyrinomonadaceae bacterium]
MRDQVRKAVDWEKAIGGDFSRSLRGPHSYRSQSPVNLLAYFDSSADAD